MTSVEERLQQLLDGELDAADLAEDPTLASLADRLYGIKIQAVAPKKMRDFAEPTPPSAPLPSTDMMIEVIGDVALQHLPAPSSDCHCLPRHYQYRKSLERKNHLVY